MIKNNFRILKNPHAYLQATLKAPVKFQKDRTKTVGRVKGTRYLLKIRNHAPSTMHHGPCTTESRKQCPSAFLRKGGGQKNRLDCPVKGKPSQNPFTNKQREMKNNVTLALPYHTRKSCSKFG